MFISRDDPKKKLFGVMLLLATVFFTFGHTLFSPPVAIAYDQTHRDEVPHSPDSEDHSPCPTELHQTVSNRTTSDDDQHSLGDLDYCADDVVNSDFAYPDDYSTFAYRFEREKIPPRLPLEQKTQLLF
jgi:hypothetical protein